MSRIIELIFIVIIIYICFLIQFSNPPTTINSCAAVPTGLIEYSEPLAKLTSEDDLLAENEDDLLSEEEVDAPEVELAGVIITPSIRMATLRAKDEQESLVAFEGQPLEGNYGSWHVSRIMPREVTLSSGNGENVQLKLQVHDVTIAAPPQPQPKAGADTQAPVAAAGEGESDQPVSRAEEIRQRIAERREELKRAAEEKGESPAKPADYQSAIRSMMSGKTTKKQSDENDR